MTFHQHKKGFTLVELLVALALATILFLTIGGSFIRVVNFHASIKGDSDVISNVSFAFDIMRRYIQGATQATQDRNNGSDCMVSQGDMFVVNRDNSTKIEFVYLNQCFSFEYEPGTNQENGQILFTGRHGNTDFTTALIDTDRVKLKNVVFQEGYPGEADPSEDVVTVLLTLRSEKSKRNRDMNIQTSFSVRHYGTAPVQGVDTIR